MMTRRQRVLTAISHREPDRVPLDLGSTGCTGISRFAYDRLKSYLSIESPTTVVDEVQQLAEVEEPVLQRLNIDTRGIRLGPPENWEDRRFPDGSYEDEWGIVRARPEGGFYYDLVRSPLSGEVTAADVERHRWPDPTDPGRYRGMEAKARAVVQSSFASVLHLRGAGFVGQSQLVRGFEGWFTDLVSQPRLAEAVLEHALEFALELTARSLDTVGDWLDVVMFTDDIGIQTGPMISPEAYRKFIKPRQARLFGLAKSKSRARILLHTCGSVVRLMEDIIDVGVDVLNPVQVTAAGMDPAALKQQFGDRIAFWGGVDTHRVLPKGSPDDVRREVRLRIQQMARGGGYVLNSVHNIQADVPPENVCAMFDAAVESGTYARE